MMVSKRYRKRDPFFVKNAVVQILFQFSISAIIGVIYGFLLRKSHLVVSICCLPC